jgi:hypothetical protein
MVEWESIETDDRKAVGGEGREDGEESGGELEPNPRREATQNGS